MPASGGEGTSLGLYIRLSIADTGMGLDAATVARAVEPFFSTKGIGKGLGHGLGSLGLPKYAALPKVAISINKAIVDQNLNSRARDP